jgi:transketolase
MRDAFLERIHAAMQGDEKIFFVTADFGSPVLDRIRADFPDRFANVGIAEQNLINVTAGLAIEGFKVFAYAIAPFITMRCYEQIRVNLCLLSEVRPMNVTLVGVGAGYSYVVSGPTHQCYEDITIMRALPNMAVYSPSDHVSTAALFEECRGREGLKYLRLDAQLLPVIYEEEPDLRDGFRMLRRGQDICLVATGYMLHVAVKVADRLALQGISVGMIDLVSISRFGSDALEQAIRGYRGMVTMEEGFRGRGGVDSMMFEFLARRNLPLRMHNIGVEGAYRFELGTRAELHEQVGIGEDAVFAAVNQFFAGLGVA